MAVFLRRSKEWCIVVFDRGKITGYRSNLNVDSMPSGLHLSNTTFFRDLVLVMRREEPFVLIDVSSTEVRRFVVVRRMFVVEQLESSETTF